MKTVYPENISKLIAAAADRRGMHRVNATGREASFTCGVSAEFRLFIDEELMEVEDAGFATNGCGYAAAVAEALAQGITGKELISLEGLSVLEDYVGEKIGPAPYGRHHCFNICFDALQNALSSFRRKRAEQWNGEEALICSCFGVSESAIETVVREKHLRTVEAVGGECRAGTGCGSCQPLVQDILDSAAG